MKARVRVEGLREMDEALGELSKAAGRNALRRAGIKALQPMAKKAAALAPVDTGELRDSIRVSAKATGTQVGKKEFAAAMRSGLGRDAAVSAMRDARRAAAADGAPAFVELFMGPTQATSKAAAVKRIVMEFGSFKDAPQPYMRPAWDSDKSAALSRLTDHLRTEINAAVGRARRKAARLAVQG